MTRLYAVTVRTRGLDNHLSYAVTANGTEEAIAKVLTLREATVKGGNAAQTIDVVWLADTSLMLVGIDGP